MSKRDDLTEPARIGFDHPEGPCVFYDSSPSGMAWRVGAWLKRTGRSEPRNVRAGRGYQIHANDMLMSINDRGEVSRVS